MSDPYGRNLPTRLAEVATIAGEVLRLLRSLNPSQPAAVAETGYPVSTPTTEEDDHRAVNLLERMAEESRALLLRATTDRNRLRLKIEEAEHADRELTMQAAHAVRRRTRQDDDDARAALRRAHRLRADLEAWRAELAEADEAARRARELVEVLAEQRAAFDRRMATLERRYQRAEATTALARVADLMRETDRRAAELAGRVDEFRARADAEYANATDDDALRILRLRSENIAYAVDEELERLRRG